MHGDIMQYFQASSSRIWARFYFKFHLLARDHMSSYPKYLFLWEYQTQGMSKEEGSCLEVLEKLTL